MIAVQVLFELGFIRLKVADCADHHRVFLLDFKNPEVIFDPRAGFDFDRPYDTQWGGKLPVPPGQCGFGIFPSSGIRRTLRASLIEQMNVAIDDRNRLRLRMESRCRGGARDRS